MHATAALYNTSLSEMTPDVLYACLCDKQARTILLLRDAQGGRREHKIGQGPRLGKGMETFYGDLDLLQEGTIFYVFFILMLN